MTDSCSAVTDWCSVVEVHAAARAPFDPAPFDPAPFDPAPFDPAPFDPIARDRGRIWGEFSEKTQERASEKCEFPGLFEGRSHGAQGVVSICNSLIELGLLGMSCSFFHPAEVFSWPETNASKTKGKVARKPNRSSSLRDGGLRRSPHGHWNVCRRVAFIRRFSFAHVLRAAFGRRCFGKVMGLFRRVEGRKAPSQTLPLVGRFAAHEAVLFKPEPVARGLASGSTAMRVWMPSVFRPFDFLFACSAQQGLRRVQDFQSRPIFGQPFLSQRTSDRSADARVGATKPHDCASDIAWPHVADEARLRLGASVCPPWGRGRAIS